MQEYTFEVSIVKTIKAKNLDIASQIIANKTDHFNECRKITLLDRKYNERN